MIIGRSCESSEELPVSSARVRPWSASLPLSDSDAAALPAAAAAVCSHLSVRLVCLSVRYVKCVCRCCVCHPLLAQYLPACSPAVSSSSDRKLASRSPTSMVSSSDFRRSSSACAFFSATPQTPATGSSPYSMTTKGTQACKACAHAYHHTCTKITNLPASYSRGGPSQP